MPHPLTKSSREGFNHVRPHRRQYRPLHRFTAAAQFLEAEEITGLTTHLFVSVCSSRQHDDCRLTPVSTVETLFVDPWS